jgi:tetratricopeptide (TPR) repeat protein
LLREKTSGPSEPTGKILGWTGERDSAQLLRSSSPDLSPLEVKSFLGRLLANRAERRGSMIENNPRFHTPQLSELLTDSALAVRPGDKESGEELGRLALLVADRLPVESCSEGRVADLKARAWASIANDRRMRSNLRGARKAMASAFFHLRNGTGDPIEEAILLDLKASLLRALRRFDQAMRVLNQAFTIFTERGDTHRAGRVLLSIETVHHASGQHEKGIPLLYRAIEMIDPEQEPALVLCAWHNLIDELAETGRFAAARILSARMEPLYQRYQDAGSQNRRKWVYGKIALGLGQPEEAETYFLAARNGFLTLQMPYDAALVSLQLVLLYVDQKRTAELKSLAQQILRIFAACGIAREALATLVCLSHTAPSSQAS